MKTSSILSVVAMAGAAIAAPVDAAPVDATTVDVTVEAAPPNFFLIRHGEKNEDGTISSQGMKRAQCLVKLFGKDSKYNIKHIMVQTPHDGDPRTQRPYNTTLPLAKSLGITIDHPCEYEDPECAGNAARQYKGPGNVLIAWEHKNLPDVATAIGAEDAPDYEKTHFDLIYNLPSPYSTVTVTSENCPGLDN